MNKAETVVVLVLACVIAIVVLAVVAPHIVNQMIATWK